MNPDPWVRHPEDFPDPPIEDIAKSAAFETHQYFKGGEQYVGSCWVRAFMAAKDSLADGIMVIVNETALE